MLVYKGTEICKIYKGSTLVQQCGPDAPAPPTNLGLQEIETVEIPAPPTNLQLTEIEEVGIPAPPTNLGLQEIFVSEAFIEWDTSRMYAAEGDLDKQKIDCYFKLEQIDSATGNSWGQYTITINGVQTTITNVVVSSADNKISIFISDVIYSDDVVRFSYAKNADPLAAVTTGNEVANITDQLLTNQSTLVDIPAPPTNLNLEEINNALPAAPTNLTLVELREPVLGTLVIDSYGTDYVVISLPIVYSGSTSDTWDLYINGALHGTYADDPISGKYIGSLTTKSVTLQILHRDSNGITQWSNQVVQQIGIYPPTNLSLVEVDNATEPNPPANLRVTNETTNSISTAWDAVSGATGYGVQWRVNGDLGWNFPVTVGNVLNYTIPDLSPDTLYDIRVYAIGSWGNTDTSDSISHRTDVDTGDATPPTAPTNFTSIVAEEDRITASWTGATDNIGVVGYNLYIRGSDASNFIFIKFVPGENGVWDSFENYSYLIHASVYTIEVESVDAAGNVSATRLRSNRIYTLVWNFNSSLYSVREMNATRYSDAPSMGLTFTGWAGYKKQIREDSLIIAGPTYGDAVISRSSPIRTSIYYGDLDTDQDETFDFTKQFTVTII